MSGKASKTSQITKNPNNELRDSASHASKRSIGRAPGDSATDGRADPRRMRFRAVKGLFSDIFAASSVESVDPARCVSIPELRVRKIVRWVVVRLKASICGEANSENLVQGFVSTGKFGVLTKVPESFVDTAIRQLVLRGYSERAAQRLSESGPLYHVVDGGHLHQSLLELMDQKPELFAGFRWPVVVIEWQAPDVIRGIARMCQEIQTENHYLEFTVPDVLSNLRDVIEGYMSATGISLHPGDDVPNGTIKSIVDLYTGGQNTATSTLRGLCAVALKLSKRVIDGISALLTEECESYSRQLGKRRPFVHDNRIYKKIISTQSLRKAETFLNPDTTTDEDRLNVIKRLRYIARQKCSFKAFQSDEIEAQTKIVLAARQFYSEFLDFLGDEEVPSSMLNLISNMFETTLVDEEIEEFMNEGGLLFPPLEKEFVNATKAHGSQKVRQYRRMKSLLHQDNATVRASTVEQQESVNRQAEDPNHPEQERTRSSLDRCENSTGDATRAGTGVENGDQQLPQGERSREQGLSSEFVPEAEDDGSASQGVLEKCFVLVRNMSLQQYEMNSVDIEEAFDFVIADPYQKVPHSDQTYMDEKSILDFVSAIRRVLVKGGYCFIFTGLQFLPMWKSAIIAAQMDVFCESFFIIKDVTKYQRMTLRGLQDVCELAVVAKKKGKHPTGFEIDKSSPYLYNTSCSMPRWCNAIDGVAPPIQRLTFKPSRSQVRPGERSPALLVELLQTFCPEDGRVLDPTAGALTTGIACVTTDRPCVLLEADERCLRFAVPRLEDFAKAKLEECEPDPAKLLSGPQRTLQARSEMDRSEFNQSSDSHDSHFEHEVDSSLEDLEQNESSYDGSSKHHAINNEDYNDLSSPLKEGQYGDEITTTTERTSPTTSVGEASSTEEESTRSKYRRVSRSLHRADAGQSRVKDVAMPIASNNRVLLEHSKDASGMRSEIDTENATDEVASNPRSRKRSRADLRPPGS